MTSDVFIFLSDEAILARSGRRRAARDARARGTSGRYPVEGSWTSLGGHTLRLLRCLVPNLAEHIGDVSSNGVDRSWQKSPNFAPVAREVDSYPR